MTEEEALEWLRGNRSMCNTIPEHPFETWQVRIAQADAAMIQQAYWIVRAYGEKYKDNINAVLNELGPGAVHVCEDGGPEDICASLAVSVSKLQREKSELADNFLKRTESDIDLINWFKATMKKHRELQREERQAWHDKWSKDNDRAESYRKLLEKALLPLSALVLEEQTMKKWMCPELQDAIDKANTAILNALVKENSHEGMPQVQRTGGDAKF